MGSVFSGIAADIFDWRATFWLLAIIYAGFFVASIWTVPVTPFTRENFGMGTWKKFDLLGVGLSMAGIALFCSSLT